MTCSKQMYSTILENDIKSCVFRHFLVVFYVIKYDTINRSDTGGQHDSY